MKANASTLCAAPKFRTIRTTRHQIFEPFKPSSCKLEPNTEPNHAFQQNPNRTEPLPNLSISNWTEPPLLNIQTMVRFGSPPSLSLSYAKKRKSRNTKLLVLVSLTYTVLQRTNKLDRLMPLTALFNVPLSLTTSTVKNLLRLFLVHLTVTVIQTSWMALAYIMNLFSKHWTSKSIESKSLENNSCQL